MGSKLRHFFSVVTSETHYEFLPISSIPMLLQLITLRSRHAISLSYMLVCVGGGGGGVREEVRGRGGETVRGRLLSLS